MKDKKNFDLTSWYTETCNDWERIFFEYLLDSDLAIDEVSPDEEEEYKDAFLLRDCQLCWDNVIVRNAADVFEAHPAIVDELIDDTIDESEDYDFPDTIVYNSDTYSYWEAGYWGAIYHLKDSEDFSEKQKTWIEQHIWQLKVCALIAFHHEEVNLEKFI